MGESMPRYIPIPPSWERCYVYIDYDGSLILNSYGEGIRVRVAVKTKKYGSKTYRYKYAVINDLIVSLVKPLKDKTDVILVRLTENTLKAYFVKKNPDF